MVGRHAAFRLSKDEARRRAPSGKLDATADRKAGTLVVNAIHLDVRFTKATTAAVRAEIEDLATWLGLEVTGS